MNNILILIFLILSYSWLNSTELILQNKHRSNITKICFFKNDSLLATSSEDAMIKIWSARTKLLVRTLIGHQNSVSDFAFTSTEDTLISVGKDNKIIFWDINTGNNIAEIDGDGLGFTSISLSPISKIFAVGNLDGTTKIYDMNTKKVITRYNSSDGVNFVCFSNDGNLLASGGNDKVIRFRKIDYKWKEPPVKEIKMNSVIKNMIFSPSDESVAYKTEEDTVYIFDLAKEKIIGKDYSNAGLCLNHKYDKEALFKNDSNALLIKKLFFGKILYSSTKCKAGITAMAFNSDESSIAAGSWQGDIFIFNLKDSTDFTIFDGINQSITSLAYNNKSNILYFSKSDADNPEQDSYFYFWNLSGLFSPVSIKTSFNMINSMACSNDGKYLAVSGLSFENSPYNLLIADPEDGSTLETIKIGTNPLKVFFSNDSKFMIVLTNDEIISFNSVSWQKISAINYHPSTIKLIIPSASDNDNILYALTDKNELRTFNIINLNNNKLIETFNKIGDITSLLSEPSNGNLLLCNNFGKIYFYDINKKRFIINGQKVSESRLNAIAFDNNKIFLCGEENIIFTYDLPKNKVISKIEKAHINTITHLIKIPGYIITAATDGLIKFWDDEQNTYSMTISAFKKDDWAVVTSNGYFDGTNNGLKNIHWVEGNSTLRPESFFTKYYQPNLLALNILHQTNEISPDYDKTAVPGFTEPPKVSITKPSKISETFIDNINVQFRVERAHSGIKKILIYLNNKLYKELSNLSSDENSFSFELSPLYPGKNVISITAISDDNILSDPESVSVSFNKEINSNNLYVVTIGNNYYSPTYSNLSYAETDAQGISDIFSRSDNRVYDSAYVYALIGKNATKNKILAALNKISKTAKISDALLIFFAGHGFATKENNIYDFKFVLFDDTKSQDAKDYQILSAQEFGDSLSKINALKQLLIIDACESSSAIDNIYSELKRESTNSKSLGEITNYYGLNILTAAYRNQSAFEFKNIKHGLFTYVILNGLNGAASYDDEYVTLGKLKTYIDHELLKISRKSQIPQVPYSRLQGLDFELLKK